MKTYQICEAIALYSVFMKNIKKIIANLSKNFIFNCKVIDNNYKWKRIKIMKLSILHVFMKNKNEIYHKLLEKLYHNF